MGVSLEQSENVNEEEMAKTQCVVSLSKKCTTKDKKVDHIFLDKSGIKVHQMFELQHHRN